MSDTINCLRCCHCRLLPDTDMKSPLATIFCEKKQERSPLILSGCGLANPEYKYRGTSQGAVKLGGDKRRNASPVELEYLRVHYPSAPWARLVRVTGRSKQTVINMGKLRGWRRSGAAIEAGKHISAASASAGRRSKGQTFNHAQREFIQECFRREFWPNRGGNKHRLDWDRCVKRIIVARVAELDVHGKVWPWESIQKHTRWTSPGYKRWDKKRRVAKREKNRVFAPQIDEERLLGGK